MNTKFVCSIFRSLCHRLFTMSFAERSHPSLPPTAMPLRPPYDPLLQSAVDAWKTTMPEGLDLATIRGVSNDFGLERVLKAKPQYDHEDISVPGLNHGDDDVILAVFTPKNSTRTDRPVVYFVHGGGQVSGHRFVALEVIMDWVDDKTETVFVSVEYRVAPEHRAPAALHDTYAGLVWTAENASRLGIDPAKIIVNGGSGGAPIAMSSAMLCRNNRKNYPCGLMILTPMLDDRDCTTSSKQFARDGPWCGTTNREAWDHVLGTESRGEVSELVAPARATDLSGLPPTFIDAGACEVFRDEAVAVASLMWKCGVSAELHVWPGAYHGFDMLSQEAPVAQVSTQVKRSWLKRTIEAREKELTAGPKGTLG